MKLIDFISSCAIPFIILLVLVYAFIEKNKVFDIFLKGARDGVEIVFKIFPTLVGLFVAIGALRSSGIIDFLTKIIKPFLFFFNIPSEIIPLAILRPISGSSSIAIATDIMKKNGVDSNIGILASTIMGATETTLYTIAIYTGSVGVKNIKYVLWISLLADFIGVIAAVIICNFLSF